MSDGKPASELSIDEILTTIRRIIAEGDQGGAAATPAAPPAAVRARVAADAVAERVAETTEKAERTAFDEDDILELTEALNEDGTTRHLAPIGGSARRAAAVAEMPAAARPERGPEPPAQRREAPPLRRTPEPPAPGAAREPRLPRDIAGGAGSRTLEEIVGDALPPLVQAWLDEHLQPLVARLVRAEMARVTRESEKG